MSLSLGLNPLLLAVCLIGAAGLTYWSYRRTQPPLSPARRGVLMALRFLALFIVLFLLFEPILRRVEQEERRPVVAVLVDDSQSLGLQDESGLDLGRVVRDALRALPLDRIDGDVRLFRFDGAVEPLSGEGFDSLRFAGARTDIARALEGVRDRLDDQNLRGVVLVSDGQYNTGRNPLYVAERYPVPIHTVVVGDTTARRDVRIRRVSTNEFGYVGVELPVQVSLRADGYAETPVSVSLMQGGRRLASREVRLPAGAGELSVDLSYTPERAGAERLSVVLSRQPGEVTFRNNAEGFTVRVLEQKKRILLLGGAPDPDLAAVRQTLEANPDLEISAFTQKSSGSFYEGELPADLTRFDAAALVGYPGREADPAVARRVAEAARNGLPIVFLMGRQTDLSLLKQAFSDVLPAVPQTIRTTFTDAALNVSPAGALHPVLDIPSGDASSWRRLPPLAYNESRWQVAPDARVLATTQVRGVVLDDPLLVVRSRDRVRSAALLAAGSWRWKNVPADLKAAENFWPTLLSNSFRWVTTREDDRPVRIDPTEPVFAGGEPVEFTGQVYDESLKPIDRASVEVTVTAPDGREYPYAMESIGNGRYALTVGALPEGSYRYRAAAAREGATLGSDAGTFEVGSLALEFRETRANADLMRQIARRSGGSFLPAAGLSELPVRLAETGSLTPVRQERAREIPLRDLPLLLGLVVALLTVEWFLRKRSGMV